LRLIFFLQAEDGIRDFHVTGVQTCALPIYRPSQTSRRATAEEGDRDRPPHAPPEVPGAPRCQASGTSRAEREFRRRDVLYGDHEIGRASCRERGVVQADVGSCTKETRDTIK